MKSFTINGKEYNAHDFDFELMCDLEDMGVEIQNIFSKPMNLYKNYLAICGNITPKEAVRELEAHIVAGNNFDELTKIIANKIEESDFFRALSQGAEKNNTTSQSKKTKKTE